MGSVFVAWFQSQRGGESQPHSPQVCLPAAGWTPTVSDRIAMDTRSGAATVDRYIAKLGAERAFVLYWYQTGAEGGWRRAGSFTQGEPSAEPFVLDGAGDGERFVPVELPRRSHAKRLLNELLCARELLSAKSGSRAASFRASLKETALRAST